MASPPAGFWEAATALFAAATLFLGVLTRKARKAGRGESWEPTERLRKFVDERAEHKARNVTSAPLLRIDQKLDELGRTVTRNQERIDALSEADKDKGERLAKQESLQEAAMRRMDAHDAAAAAEREEELAWRDRIEGKLDRLIERGVGGRA